MEEQIRWFTHWCIRNVEYSISPHDEEIFYIIDKEDPVEFKRIEFKTIDELFDYWGKDLKLK